MDQGNTRSKNRGSDRSTGRRLMSKSIHGRHQKNDDLEVAADGLPEHAWAAVALQRQRRRDGGGDVEPGPGAAHAHVNRHRLACEQAANVRQVVRAQAPTSQRAGWRLTNHCWRRWLLYCGHPVNVCQVSYSSVTGP